MSDFEPQLRPPAVPLVACDPYLSLWSCADHLTDTPTSHWTGEHQRLSGLIRIDGQSFSFCGENRVGQEKIPAMEQQSVEVLPTRTRYVFEAAGVRLHVRFVTPALPHDLDWLSRAVTYVLLDVAAIDGREHAVGLYFDVGAEIAVDSVYDSVTWGRSALDGMDVLRTASSSPRMLERAGDLLRIEWGSAYLIGREFSGTFLGRSKEARRSFVEEGCLPADDELEHPMRVYCNWPAMCAALDCGSVGESLVSRHLILAYDDVFSVEHMHRKLRPWWRRHGAGAKELLMDADRAYPAIIRECEQYDERIMAQLRERGGGGYAGICALAFRQCLAAHKLVAGEGGEPLYFSKENQSNGCIATVDVTYPSSPFFLWLSPELLKAQLEPVLAYAASERWKFPFAPHDLGTYPLANGQIYGGGEESEDDQMPVEECGNMLILVAALVLRTNDLDFARQWWGLLEQWSDYLQDKGLDPANQLCTDDFAGHLAHNTNLSLKAIIALGAFARLASAVGQSEQSDRVYAVARAMAGQWCRMADDGDHYRLAFDVPGSWSQKYNLVWDRLLGLNLFPAEVAEKEMAWYRQRLNTHGLPLDSRKTYTKLDWIFWTATLTGRREDFDAVIAPSLQWLNAGVSRVPMTDWYETVGDGPMVGFKARSVVGGLFLRQLDCLGDGAEQAR